ncbi:hypothetical protein [Desulfobacula sp.]|uniref:hypothetical protein n=1 Tax=Desulfobacula sp. TaxID=2593537 RepID=UPI0025BC733E|nr:hypothetical protein [Desulfobacula sp.]MBC2705656.1 hypothetical protein [Desulfobacula sp.]
MKCFKMGIVISFGLFFLAGCHTVGVGVQIPGTPHHQTKYHKPGPPPHAPAHGYRHKHRHGHDLEYRSGLGAYVVVNIPETYFGNNLYIRMSTDGRWMVSARLEHGWRVAVGNEVPYKLKKHKKYKKKHKTKYHKPGPPPHAPAHGYRHKHRHGHDLEYRSGLGAYVVVNIPETYFGNNLYIRMSTDGRWMVSARLEKGWRVAVGNEVPYKLREHKKYKKKSKKRKKT